MALKKDVFLSATHELCPLLFIQTYFFGSCSLPDLSNECTELKHQRNHSEGQFCGETNKICFNPTSSYVTPEIFYLPILTRMGVNVFIIICREILIN